MQSFFIKKREITFVNFRSRKPKNINYFENKGSAQCKSSVMFAALNTVGKTLIKAKKSRNHSELLFKYLKIPIKIKKNKNYDFIELENPKKISAFNYKIPGDISSAAFFIVLTILSKNSKLLIKDVNVNSFKNRSYKNFKENGCRNNI